MGASGLTHSRKSINVIVIIIIIHSEAPEDRNLGGRNLRAT